MVVLLKILIILGILLLMAYPLLPLSHKLRWFSTCRRLRYDHPHNRKNAIFILLAAIEIVVLSAVFSLLSGAGEFIYNLPILHTLFEAVGNKLPDQVKYIVTVTALVIVVNLIAIYGFVFFKAIVKKLVMDYALTTPEEREKKRLEKEKRRLEKKKKKLLKKKGETEEKDPTNKEVPETPEPQDDIPAFPHDDKKPDEDEDIDPLEGLIGFAEGDELALKPTKNRFLGLFFEGDYYQYARHWVHRVTAILRLFIVLTEIFYFTLFFGLLLAVFFPLPEGFYGILRTLTEKLYIYPFVSLILLQEVCNTFKAPVKEGAYAKEALKKKKKEEEADKEVDLFALRNELLSCYGEEHCIRYFPATPPTAVNEYVVTNKTYASAIRYIGEEMKRVSGHVVQRYLEGVDALFNNTHISFAASFYSELGEYLIAYTYIRLLAGERQLFIVSDRSRVKPLKEYISQRLRALTGCTEDATWRVLTMDDRRLVQAKVVVACPEDFKRDNIVEHFPAFFEEVCNAIFVDADRILSLDSYLCPIMAVRLQQVTQGRVRFVFLSRHILHGFGNSLKKFFCIDEVLDYSSLEENERVNYFLWNRESKRIYQGREQRTTALESKIAALAADYGIDGVRVLTKSPFDGVEKNELIVHKVEFNEFHKKVPDINYLICTDEDYNLASAIYAYTRFRGKKESTLHIVSKPYLLREYFMAHIERYVNRSSFVQPRVTEHASDRKLSLLRVYCEGSSPNGIVEEEFCQQMEAILKGVATTLSPSLCPFCHQLEEKFKREGSLTTREYAAYVIAGLCDNEETPEKLSEGNKLYDYFVYTNETNRGHTIKSEIIRVRFGKNSDVFEKVLACNERVELRLNDRTLGILDTFPTRVFQQYQKGQTILYNNAVYEIESISPDGRIIYIHQEAITDVRYLDTVPIRRYQVTGAKEVGDMPHRVTFTRGAINSIELWRMNAEVESETYAYHWLVTDGQVLDFVKGVSGDKLISEETVAKQKRSYKKSPMLSLSIRANTEPGNDAPCNDRMRLLLAAVFNEFIRTIFPSAYRCISVCPVLEEPLNYPRGADIVDYNDHVKTVYPYLKATSAFTTDPTEIRLIFINDCVEDVGVLDLLYNSAASLIQEFLTNVYGYLYWLKQNKTLAGDQKHYIYFGADELPEVYDLDGCCRLLKGFNKIFSDGKTDSMTVIEEDEDDELYCAFCHEKLERGRFFRFDKKRLICTDCLTKSVRKPEDLEKLFEGAKKYWEKTFVGEKLPDGVKAAFDKVYELDKEPYLNEHFYRLDCDNKTILVEKDIPAPNVEAVLLRGLIEFWHMENDMACAQTEVQLCYEELIYRLSEDRPTPRPGSEALTPEQLRAADLYLLLGGKGGEGLVDVPADLFKVDIHDNGEEERASVKDVKKILSLLDETRREMLLGLCEYILKKGDGEPTSFTYLNEVMDQLRKSEIPEEPEDPEDPDNTEGGDDSSDMLYDPDTIPRIWKRYLLNEKASGSVDTISADAGGEQTVAPLVADADGDTDPTDTPVVTDIPDDPADPDKGDKGNKGNKEDKAALKLLKKQQKEEEAARKKAAKEENRNKKKQAKEEEDTRKKRNPLHGKIKSGIELCPYDEREKTNPKLALYCAILRHIADFDNTPFSVSSITVKDLEIIYSMVENDYPELFWTKGYRYRYSGDIVSEVTITFRCTDASGNIDAKQIREKRNEIRAMAKTYTAGIKKTTDPYEAVLTIYRRLILSLDYDDVGLDAGAGRDTSKDDTLRSLHSALVGKKVVCAGYAVAMQYLLQKVGIPCASVTSEKTTRNKYHAFNLVKIGKKCYYLDATWGDQSTTKKGTAYSKDVFYNYFLVPLSEFKLASSHDYTLMHTPNRELYPFLEDMEYSDLEYHRVHGYYLGHYDDARIKAALEKTVATYDSKEMGDFAFNLRCPVSEFRDFTRRLIDNGGLGRAVRAVLPTLKGKNAKLLSNDYTYWANDKTGTIRIKFK